jgi:hypothetical protein
MAATKTDPIAAKQAKQKKILIVGSVLLVALLAIQLPKLLGGDSAPAAAPATTAAATPGVAGSGPTSTVVTTTAASQTAPAVLADATAVKAGKAQLASFSLFETKDPFVQQIKTDEGTKAAAGTASGSKAAAASGKGSTGAGGKATPAAVLTFATISVNGEPEALEVKGVFPADDPVFRLVAVSASAVKIGIAGGSLTDGKTVSLKKGKKLTLVNTATGARYTLDLLYTGTAPEQTATFTSSQEGGDAATQAAPTTTTP